MLFDLRGAGRRRTVKAVYIGLAVIMFVGFVGFSIGSSGLGGGIIDAITQNNGGGSDTATKRFRDQVAQAERATRATPRRPGAWADLALAHVRMAGVGGNYDQARNDYTPAGKAQLRGASAAWDRYMALNPKHPDDRLARLMLQAFVSLNDPARAAQAQEIVTASNPTSKTYAQLAVYAYQAGQVTKGDAASLKAVDLAPKAQKKALKAQLAQAKSQASKSPQPGSTPAASG